MLGVFIHTTHRRFVVQRGHEPHKFFFCFFWLTSNIGIFVFVSRRSDTDLGADNFDVCGHRRRMPCGLRGTWVSRIPRGDAPPRVLRHANRPSEACAHMNICVRCGACRQYRRRHGLRRRYYGTICERLVNDSRLAVVN